MRKRGSGWHGESDHGAGRVAVLALGFGLAAGLPCRGGWIFDGKPSTWEGTPDELKVREETHPVLRLELSGQWTDFEIQGEHEQLHEPCLLLRLSGHERRDVCAQGHLIDDPAPTRTTPMTTRRTCGSGSGRRRTRRSTRACSRRRRRWSACTSTPRTRAVAHGRIGCRRPNTRLVWSLRCGLMAWRSS